MAMKANQVFFCVDLILSHMLLLEKILYDKSEKKFRIVRTAQMLALCLTLMQYF